MQFLSKKEVNVNNEAQVLLYGNVKNVKNVYI